MKHIKSFLVRLYSALEAVGEARAKRMMMRDHHIGIKLWY
jgi:hypothetical protein